MALNRVSKLSDQCGRSLHPDGLADCIISLIVLVSMLVVHMRYHKYFTQATSMQLMIVLSLLANHVLLHCNERHRPSFLNLSKDGRPSKSFQSLLQLLLMFSGTC